MSSVVAIASRAKVTAFVGVAGPAAETRFLEFFAANIHNAHTRPAYAQATRELLAWCERAGLMSITDVKPLQVAAYVEQLGRERSTPTVKQRLVGIRQLFDRLVMGQVVPVNQASSIRGPSHSVKRGKTPVLDPSEARALLDSIDGTKAVSLCDRALDRAHGPRVRADRPGTHNESRGRPRAESPALGSAP
jgi:site-specific recombinase XerC